MRVCLAPNRYLLDHLNPVTFQADDLLRIIRQEAELAHAKIEKNLRAESVIPQIGREPEARICFHRIETFLLQLVGMNFRGQPEVSRLVFRPGQPTLRTCGGGDRSRARRSR